MHVTGYKAIYNLNLKLLYFPFIPSGKLLQIHLLYDKNIQQLGLVFQIELLIHFYGFKIFIDGKKLYGNLVQC